jgi:hypothetical protein
MKSLPSQLRWDPSWRELSSGLNYIESREKAVLIQLVSLYCWGFCRLHERLRLKKYFLAPSYEALVAVRQRGYLESCAL